MDGPEQAPSLVAPALKLPQPGETDRGPEFVLPFESVIVTAALQEQEAAHDPHAEINARRASVEDPEMLRHLRSL